MNGEVVNYRLNDPMGWDEFKVMPDDIKKMYIDSLREKFNVPNKEIADMLGVCQATFSKHLKFWGLNGNKSDGASRKKWDREGWSAWTHGIKVSESPCDISSDAVDNVNIRDPQSEETKKNLVPSSGHLTFTGSIEDIFNTLSTLFGDEQVCMTVEWETVEED